MRMNTNDANIKSLILLLVISYLLLVISPVSAAEPSIWTGIESCREKGDCALNDFLILGINVSKIILRYAGVFAIVLFIIGGLIWMTSGGAQEKIQTGKKIITGALTGMFIILFSYVLVNTVLTGLVGKKKAEEILKKEAVQQEMVCPVPPTNEKPWRNVSGCQNNEIKNYQARLNALNCLCGTEDGIFGPTTESCTKRFQCENLLSTKVLNNLKAQFVNESPSELDRLVAEAVLKIKQNFIDGKVGPTTYEIYQKVSPDSCVKTAVCNEYY